MMMGIQILGILFALFMAYLTFLHYKRQEFTGKEMALWAVMWVAFIVISVSPGLLNPIVESLSFARTMDLLIVLGFMFLIGITFFNYLKLKKTQKKIEDLVRGIAIRRAKK